MADKNTSNSIASETSALPAKSIEAAPAAVSIEAKKSNEDVRDEPRIHVKWHVDALVDGQDVYHGFIKSVSVKGLDIFLEYNLQNVKLIKLQIHLPPLHKTNSPHAVVATGKILYSVYDSTESLFRSGISFIKFNSETDLAQLQSCIANH